MFDNKNRKEDAMEVLIWAALIGLAFVIINGFSGVIARGTFEGPTTSSRALGWLAFVIMAVIFIIVIVASIK